MTPDRKAAPTPSWRKQRMLGIGFLLAGIIVTIVNRLAEALHLGGLGPGFIFGALVVLGAAWVNWSRYRGSGQDA